MLMTYIANGILHNHTSEQSAEWERVSNTVRLAFSQDAVEAIKQAAREEALITKEWYCAMNLAIRMAKAKFSAPILDDVEYHEIMAAQEIMENQ